MQFYPKARAWLRALLAAAPGASAGAMVAFVLCGAFLAGGMAKDAVLQGKASRLAGEMGGLSDEALRRTIQNDPSALSIALRYDGSDAARASLSQQEQLLAKTLDGKLRNPQVVRASLVVAARPWNASPLDQARQLDCLSEAVYYEARGETPAGQAAVAQVVLNRVRHPSFPKSVCAVVYQGAESGRCQFSFACNGAMRAVRESAAWARAQKVASRALGGYVMADVGNSTHFHVTSVRPGWTNLTRVTQVGSHVFYRFGGRNGAPEAFDSTPQAEPGAELILASAQAAAGDDADEAPAANVAPSGTSPTPAARTGPAAPSA